jgi:hypothetical protein
MTANCCPLFPELDLPVMPARWPMRGTRAHQALSALMRGPVNQADYGPSWRLAAAVQSLEYDGWSIISRRIVHPRCMNPIAEYTLDRQDPATAAALALYFDREGARPDRPAGYREALPW